MGESPAEVLQIEQKQQIRAIADNLPKLWSAETTTPAQRKEIIRQVIQSVQVTVMGESELVTVQIQWWGGAVTQTQLIRPVAKWTQLSYYSQLCQRIEQLFQQGVSADEITAILQQEGFRPPKRRQTLNVEEIRELMHRLGLLSPRPLAQAAQLGEHEWWLADLARQLDMPVITLYAWIQSGWINARQVSETCHRWIVWADEAELARLQKHRQTPIGEVLRQRWHGQVPNIAQTPTPPSL